MKILIVTDTWASINGVATTLKATCDELILAGHNVVVIEPSLFRTVSLPGYQEVKISINLWKVAKIIRNFKPDAIHIATEGPLGWTARNYCNKRDIPYSTSYHTKFPEYLNLYYKIPKFIGYFVMKKFHSKSKSILVTTDAMKQELIQHGFKNLVVWSRGVDRSIFNSCSRRPNVASKPILLCVSRASIEKGIDDFCKIETSGTKLFVGDGPYLNELKDKYKDVIFTGYKTGKQLAHYYANADVFVFPSRTDTFGVVMLESMACGTPVAAYPVTGPIDIIKNNVTGYLSQDLSIAINNCININRNIVEEHSQQYSWKDCTKIFEENLSLIKT